MHPPTLLIPHDRRAGRIAAIAVLAAVLLTIGFLPPTSQAAERPATPTGPGPALRLAEPPGALGTAFAAAGAEYSVPPALLEAIAWVENHWESRGGTPNDYNQYGVMGLSLPPGGDSLARAAALLGVDPAVLQKDETANIRGAAALLRDLARNEPAATPTNLAGWYEVVARYTGFTDPLVARSYAFSVFTVLKEGVNARTSRGEAVNLPAAGNLELPDRVDPLTSAPDTDDYPPAHWVPAAGGNFQYGRDYGPLNFIVIHDTEGTYQSAINWFQNPSSGVSAHFVIRSWDGDITQMVHNADTAYHAGNWDYNVRAIGVEHEGYMNQTGWYTTAMYNASAALVRTMADRFGILKDHAHIIGHYQVPNQRNPPHTDPGPNWDWASYLALVRRDWTVAARVRNSDSGFAATPAVMDRDHGWSAYPGGWNGGTAYRALSVTGGPTNLATWSATLPGVGLYDIYAFIPWVDNGRAETSSARYTIATTNGPATVVLNQKAITDSGIRQGNLAPQGEWAHLGRFNSPAAASVSLSNSTNDTNLNVWFDTIMWIPAGTLTPPTAVPTSTPRPPPTVTPVPTLTHMPVPDTATPVPTATDTPLPPTATWTPGPCGMRFTDLPDTDWAYPYVSDLFCTGVISGYSDGTFRGAASATRGQLAKMITLGMNWYIPYPQVPTFTDVPVGSPFFYYVETAYAYGVISGYDDHTFRPYNTITRAQLSKMIVLAKGWTPLTPPVPSFSDVPSTHWAYGFIEAIHAQNVVSGYADGTFHPGNDATRSQLSKMLSTAFHLPNGLGGTATPVADATGTVTATAVTATTTATAVAETSTATATPLTRR
jgi:hypothetical protein